MMRSMTLLLTILLASSAAAAEETTDNENSRRPASNAELRYWLGNMVWYHGFSTAEIQRATGLSAKVITAAQKRFKITAQTRPPRPAGAPLLVLPYPGGRHPRIGFLDGAVHPQRETKLSVFAPWDEKSYVVLDVPEAIRLTDDRNRGLLYLAHTHVPTLWTKKDIELRPLEWQRNKDGTLVMERRLPNGVVFGTKVTPARDAVRMQMWLTNGSDEKLTGLRVQNCVMLKGAPELAGQTNDNKVLSQPYVACKNAKGDRWVITAWDPCLRAWANPPCPCMHSDPQFPDCAPGQTRRLRGWLSFYQGKDVQAEFRRIEATGWRKPSPQQGNEKNNE